MRNILVPIELHTFDVLGKLSFSHANACVQPRSKLRLIRDHLSPMMLAIRLTSADPSGIEPQRCVKCCSWLLPTVRFATARYGTTPRQVQCFGWGRSSSQSPWFLSCAL